MGWKGCRSALFAVFGLAIGVMANPLFAAEGRVWIGQKTATDCGRAVLAMLAAIRNGGDPEQSYRRIANPADRRHGYAVPEMVGHARAFDIDLDIVAPTGGAGFVIQGDCGPSAAVDGYFDRLLALTANNAQVIVPTRNRDGTNHYLLIVSSDGGRFTVLDPSRKGTRRLDVATMRKLTCPLGYVALLAQLEK